MEETIKWISIGEKLPEYKKNVLLYVVHYDREIRGPHWITIGKRKYTDERGENWEDSDEMRISGTVEYWANLPKGPVS